MRRIVLVGLALLTATAAVAAASTGGLPNIGKPSMKAQPVYKGYYDHHIDTYLITDVSSKSQAQALHVLPRVAHLGMHGEALVGHEHAARPRRRERRRRLDELDQLS